MEIRGTRSTVRVVVHGLAKIHRGSERLLLAEGESTCPPSGVQHRLTNAGEDAVEIIEVQTESRLSEKVRQALSNALPLPESEAELPYQVRSTPRANVLPLLGRAP